MIAATVLAVVFYAPIMIAPKTMLSMFITDASIVAEGAPMLRVLFSMYISYGVLILAITFFQAVGKGGAAALMAMLRQVALFLPLVVILPRFFSHNVEGVFYAQLITDAVVLVIGIFLMTASFKSMKSEERNERRAAIA
jgi:Na+-driven multidrug efflux pump